MPIDAVDPINTYTLHALFKHSPDGLNSSNLGDKHAQYSQEYTIESEFSRDAVKNFDDVAKELANLAHYKSTSLTSEQLHELALELEDNENVEQVFLTPNPTTTNRFVKAEKALYAVSKEPTPNFKPRQFYLADGGTSGLDVIRSHLLTHGEGVAVRHIDFGLENKHENLKQSKITIHSNRKDDPDPELSSDTNHGTASTGIICAKRDDNIGIEGIAYNCDFHFYDTDKVAKAYEDCKPGEIYSLGIQNTRFVPNPDNPKKPIRVDDPVTANMYYWNLLSNLVKRQCIVIYSAGNGGNDVLNTLDMPNNNADPGAIMCCSSNASGKRDRLTNYNYHKCMHARGGELVTLGYGDLFDGGSKTRKYTETYGGANGAQPLIAGCLALIQSYHFACRGRYLNNEEMFEIVKKHGVDRTHDKIGYMPNAFKSCLFVSPVIDQQADIDSFFNNESFAKNKLKERPSIIVHFKMFTLHRSYTLKHKNLPKKTFIVFTADTIIPVFIAFADCSGHQVNHYVTRNHSLILECTEESVFSIVP